MMQVQHPHRQNYILLAKDLGDVNIWLHQTKILFGIHSIQLDWWEPPGGLPGSTTDSSRQRYTGVRVQSPRTSCWTQVDIFIDNTNNLTCLKLLLYCICGPF